MRRPVILKEATCIITDNASMTNTPPTISNKNSWGQRVVPEKPQRSSGQRTAEDLQLSNLRVMRQAEVASEPQVADHIGEPGQRRHRDKGHADRQPVEAVRQVDGV